MFWSRKTEPTCRPLGSGPPVSLPCAPTLILSAPEWIPETLGDVLRNDLLFSSARKARWNLPDHVMLNVLNFCDGKSLVALTTAFGGSKIVPERELYAQDGHFLEEKLDPLRQMTYQAIIVDDSSMVNEPAVARFVADKYDQADVSVVIMSIEGIFNMRPYLDLFGINWAMTAYTKRTIHLTELGNRILSTEAFAPATVYSKASFIEGPGALFAEYIDPSEYEEDGDPVPDPSPGSPVVCVTRGNKSVSYFGFVNSLDVSYGSIILRLCYAAHHVKDQVE